MRHVASGPDANEYKALTEPVFLILTSLADQPRHGYALMQDIQQMSGGRVILSTGTLYGALRRLLEDGLIERFQQEDKSRDKQAYKLTLEGRRQLAGEVERMKRFARIASARMRERGRFEVMQRAYRAILGLYPPEYRATFAPEMVEVFEQAKADAKKRGFVSFVLFAASELGGLLRGLVSERIRKSMAQEAYITSRSKCRQGTDASAEIKDVQRHLEHLIRAMEFAIAHHDFPKARFYSNEERNTRALLQRL